MKQRVTFILFMLATVLVAASAWAEDYYVQSVKAKVMAQTSFKAPVLGEVGKGYKFSSLGRQGSWIKVTLNGKTGYVASLLVSPHPPLDKPAVIRAHEGDISQGVRRRASTYTSAAAARGLTSEDRKRASAEEEIDYKALEKMEAFTVSSDEVTKFMEGGRP